MTEHEGMPDATTSHAGPEAAEVPAVASNDETPAPVAPEGAAPATAQGLAPVRHNAFKDLSSGGQMAATWFRQLGRALKTCRLYKRENPVCIQLRDLLYTELLQHLDTCGTWVFHITPVEIFLLDEAVVRPLQ